jgi:hypothetical protein
VQVIETRKDILSGDESGRLAFPSVEKLATGKKYDSEMTVQRFRRIERCKTDQVTADLTKESIANL